MIKRWSKATIVLLSVSALFAVGMAAIWYIFGDKFSSTDVIEAGVLFFIVMLAILIIGNWKK